MAAQRHEIDPLGRERRLQRLGYVMHHVGYSPEQVVVPSHIDDVGARRDDGVSEQRRIPAKKCHDVVVAVHQLMLVVRMPTEIGANKAWPLLRTLDMRGNIETWHHRAFGWTISCSRAVAPRRHRDATVIPAPGLWP